MTPTYLPAGSTVTFGAKYPDTVTVKDECYFLEYYCPSSNGVGYSYFAIFFHYSATSFSSYTYNGETIYLWQRTNTTGDTPEDILERYPNAQYYGAGWIGSVQMAYNLLYGDGSGGVSGVTVEPSEIGLNCGDEFQFTATVEGEGIYDRSVIFSLIDIDSAPGTTVGQSTGYFTLDPEETKSIIRIYVQSVQEPDLFDVATVIVLDNYDPGGGDEGGEGGGGGDTPDPVPDIRPVYRKVSGAWVKITAYQRISGEWVRISTAGG